MTVLVTGGAGFIGSHLVDRLAAQRRTVVVVDNLHRGIRTNVRHALDGGVVEFIEGDIRDHRLIERLRDRGPFGVIYHLAALHFIPECVAQPTETLSVNVVGTQRLVSALPVRRFLFASTGDVYAPKDKAHVEGDRLDPFNIYGLSKCFGERLLEAAARLGANASFAAARLFNVYGPRETNPHIIPQLIDQIRRGGEVRLGNLWPRRDYTYVADVVDALMALERLESPAPFDVFNVGTGTATSVQELAELTGEVLNIQPQVRFEEARARPVERPHLQADYSKIERVAGWRPRFSLRQGLTELYREEGLLS